jgi:hypothetical protein
LKGWHGDYELVDTDLRKTDSVIRPLMGVIVIKSDWRTHDEADFDGVHDSTQTYLWTISLLPHGEKWKVVRMTKELKFAYPISDKEGKVEEAPDELDWAQGALNQ